MLSIREISIHCTKLTLDDETVKRQVKKSEEQTITVTTDHKPAQLLCQVRLTRAVSTVSIMVKSKNSTCFGATK